MRPKIMLFLGVYLIGLIHCADTPGGALQIVRNQLVDPSTCLATSTISDSYISVGKLDVMLKKNYFLYALVQNNMVSIQNPTFLLDSNDVQLVRAEISYIVPAGVPALEKHTEYISGVVQSGGGTMVADFTLLPDEYVDQIMAVVPISQGGIIIPILTTVKLYGKNQDGLVIQSNVFEYQIDLCYGCLMDWSITTSGVSCSNCEEQLVCGYDCAYGQDQPADCRCFCCLPQNPDDVDRYCL